MLASSILQERALLALVQDVLLLFGKVVNGQDTTGQLLGQEDCAPHGPLLADAEGGYL